MKTKWNFIDLSGQVFGLWQVLDRAPNTKSKQAAWNCICMGCGTKAVVASKTLRWRESSKCMACRKKEAWRGIGEVSGTYWCKLRQGADERDIVVDVTLKEIADLFDKQTGLCAITGVAIWFGHRHKETTASLDRIDSSQGYFLENVRWVHKAINLMRLNMSDERFLSWCKLVVEYSESQSQAVIVAA